MRRSELCFFSNRFFRNSSRALSTSAISSGVPRLGSNSHTCLPMWLLLVRSHGPPPSAILSLHIAGSKGVAGKPYSRFAPRMRRWRDRPDRGGEGWIGVLGEDEVLKRFTFEVSELHWVAMDPKLRVGGESGPEVAERCTRLWRDLARCVTWLG
ncbi:hypothetical protein BHE74_00046419 [Ensete ventricosum]|nr:hypothetical protein BHE74_00046419 [Ensete ventricosum]